MFTRFSVKPKDETDAHLAYSGTRVELSRTLSVQVAKTLSKNLSCQHENQLLQVSTTGKGLGLRGAQITVHEHFDGTWELLWGKRKLTHSVMDKPQRQSPLAKHACRKSCARRGSDDTVAKNGGM